MEKALVERLEAAVARLEAVIANGSTTSARKPDGDLPTATDPAILALHELVDGPLRRVVTSAERIGGKIIEATQTLEEAFGVEKELLIKAKPTQPPNQLLADLAKSLQTLFDALSSAIATLPDKHALLKPVQKDPPIRQIWRRSDTPVPNASQPVRSEIVRLKLDELRRASSPSHPICFKCGDCGHKAGLCHNATLCFVCNQLGNRSSQCCAIVALPSVHKQVQQELALMKKSSCGMEIAMAGSTDRGTGSLKHSRDASHSQGPITPPPLLTIGSGRIPISDNTEGKQVQDPIQVKTSDSDSLDDILCEIEDNRQKQVPEPDFSTPQIQEFSVPVTPMGQDSGISQLVRTTIKKAKSGSTERNKVALSREKKRVHFKRTAASALREKR